MESLFRLFMVRPPTPVPDNQDAATVVGDTQIERRILAALKQEPDEAAEKGLIRQDLVRAVDEIPNTHKLNSDRPSDLSQSLLALETELRKASDKASLELLKLTLMTLTNKDLPEIAESEAFKSLRSEASQRIIAAKFGSQEDLLRLRQLVQLARITAIIEVAAQAIKSRPEDHNTEKKWTTQLSKRIQVMLTTPVLLPSALFPLPKVRLQIATGEAQRRVQAIVDAAESDKKMLEVDRKQVEQAIERYKELQEAASLKEKAIAAILAKDSERLSDISKAFDQIDKRLRALAEAERGHIQKRQEYLQTLREIRLLTQSDLKLVTKQIPAPEARPVTISKPTMLQKLGFRQSSKVRSRVQMPQNTFSSTKLMIEPSKLTDNAKNTIRNIGLDPASDDFHSVYHTLEARLKALSVQIEEVDDREAGGKTKFVAFMPGWRKPGNFVLPGKGEKPGVGGLQKWPEEGEEGLPGRPRTFGHILPTGVGDLLVVRQQLKGYETGEIAHVENVLPGEERRREHERRLETEEIVLREEETSRSEERDLESTDRFEMARSTSETVQTDVKAHVGMSASYTYGPGSSVSVDATMDGSRVESKSQTEAQTYARDVTARTASSITERVLQRRTQRTLEAVVEKNIHGLKGGAEPGVYIYQWLNKLYEAQIFNYGKRLMFDIVVPEPAALIIKAADEAISKGVPIKEPKPLTETVNDIDEGNYDDIAARYGLTGIEPPPAPTIVVPWQKAWPSAGWEEDYGAHSEAEKLKIPDNYQMTVIQVTAIGGGYEDEEDKWSVKVNVDKYLFVFAMQGGTKSQDAVGETIGEIPVGYVTYAVSDLALNVSVTCRVTDRKREEWRVKTFGAIQDAYQKEVAQYNQALIEQATTAGPVVSGRNPEQNRVTERLELRRLCISMLTGQQFEYFGAIENAGTPLLPQIRFDEAEEEGPYIRFVEEAFEWESISYQFYPYFWSRRSTWVQRTLFADADPLFNEFLRAGAARVTVPVRPGFENSVMELIEKGDPWGQDGQVDLGSTEYLSVAQLIKEVTDFHGKDAEPYGEAWEIKLPTSLVVVRKEPGLPLWEKDDQGDWRPVQTHDDDGGDT